MMYLLDTMVVSEITKKHPNKRVVEWLSSIHSDKFAISVITLGEIRKGIEMLADEAKKLQIISWLDNELMKKFDGRIIEIDAAVADKWGYICSATKMPAIDALIGASALVHNLKLVTRNINDFYKITGLEIINPWNIG